MQYKFKIYHAPEVLLFYRRIAFKIHQVRKDRFNHSNVSARDTHVILNELH